jgi:hypothetical protein
MVEDSGFVDVHIGPPIDTFGGAKGEPNARKFETPSWLASRKQNIAASSGTSHGGCGWHR